MREHEKKIAIMTWYTYKNFGSALQASALSNVINNMGYQSFMIKYYPKGRRVEKENINLKWIFKKVQKKIDKFFNSEYISKERNNLFDEYINKNLKQTKICKTFPELSDLNNEFDAFVCGSDQIWSPLCYDDKYFLSFVKQSNKMVAYAPSFGTANIENSFIKSEIMKWLHRFENISVRESQGVELIKQLTSKNAELVLDPTLLMSSTEWDLYLKSNESNKKINGEYIICYFLGSPQKYMNYVKKLSKIVKVPYYVIPITKRQYESKHVVPFDIGPREFVELISNAKYVCTDSFHGMAFAINYNIPFSVFKRFANKQIDNQNSRILSLLKILKLDNRCVEYKSFNLSNDILYCDFTKANELLEIERDKSYKYLSNSLDKASNSSIMNSEYTITDLCCGCGACSVVCPKNAISIKKDNDGFEHYYINKDSCIGCGICKKVCPMTNISAKEINANNRLYSAKSYTQDVLDNSSSGGIGYELARIYNNTGKYVCGCAYDIQINSARHVIVSPNNQDRLSDLQGSKYIQSISVDALKEIVRLAQNENVIFFGTPCQVAAMDKLMRYFNARENVLLVDLICHGVPSSFLWRKYLKDINEKFDIGINPIVKFRSKEIEWRRLLMVLNGNGNVYKAEECVDDFYAFFRRGLCYMKSCYECPYRERSAADIRIGDYWGDRFKEDKQGVSMVITNSIEGRNILEYIKENKICDIKEQNVLEYWLVQYPYNNSRPIEYSRIIEALKNDELLLNDIRNEFCEYYDKIEKINKIKRAIKKII